MADYRVVDVEQLETDLTSVADAIRNKGSTSDTMTFPDGFVDSIASLSVSSSNTSMLNLIARTISGTYSTAVTSVGQMAFAACTELEKVYLTSATSVGVQSFSGCSGLTFFYGPKITKILGRAFQSCSSLTSISFPAVTSIFAYAFSNCSALTKLYITNEDAVCTLSDTTAFVNTPIADGTGVIYVPSALVASYKAATNWSAFADQIKANPT